MQVPVGAADARSYFLQAAAKLAANGGGIWRIDAGVYNLSRGITIPASNVHLIGAGMNQTRLRLISEAPPWPSE